MVIFNSYVKLPEGKPTNAFSMSLHQLDRDDSRNLAPSAARTHPNTGRLQKEPDEIGRCGDEFAMKQM